MSLSFLPTAITASSGVRKISHWTDKLEAIALDTPSSYQGMRGWLAGTIVVLLLNRAPSYSDDLGPNSYF